MIGNQRRRIRDEEEEITLWDWSVFAMSLASYTLLSLIMVNFGDQYARGWVWWALWVINLVVVLINMGDMAAYHPEWFVVTMGWVMMPIYHMISRWSWVRRLLHLAPMDFSREVHGYDAGQSWWCLVPFKLIMQVYMPVARRLSFLPTNFSFPLDLWQVLIEPAIFFGLGVYFYSISNNNFNLSYHQGMSPWFGVWLMVGAASSLFVGALMYFRWKEIEHAIRNARLIAGPFVVKWTPLVGQ